MSKSIQVYLRCRVGREWYALNVDSVIRVLHMVALAELPDAHPNVLGLLTLPDRVIPVIDLRRCFGLADAPLELETPIVAVDTSHGSVGLVVDEADDIESVEASQLAAYTEGVSPYVMGIARLPDQLLLLLDTSRLGAEARSAASNPQQALENFKHTINNGERY